MGGAAELVVLLLPAHQAGAGGDALLEDVADRVDADDVLGLLPGEPHVQEALAAQRVEQEAVLRHREQHAHRVRQLGCDPQPQHDVLKVFAVEGVDRGVGRAEAVGVVLAGAGAAALADHEDVFLGEPVLLLRHVEASGDEADRRPPVGQVQQPVLDVGDPDVAGRVAVDGVRADGPHLGVGGAVVEQRAEDLLGQGEVLPALDGHHLLAAEVALGLVLPDDRGALPGPAPVVEGDDGPAGQHLVERQGEGEAHRAAAGDGDPQHAGVRGTDPGNVEEGKVHDRLHGVLCLVEERFVTDPDAVVRAQHMPGDALVVDEGAVPAVPVVEDEPGVLREDLGVQPGGTGTDDHDVVVALAPEAEGLAAQNHALSGERTRAPDDDRWHSTPLGRRRC